MKKILVSSLLLLSLVTLFSCSRGRVIGKWDDNIHLAKKSVTFSARGDSVIISTLGSWWWITGVSIDTTNYYNFSVNQSKDYYSIKEANVVVGRRGRKALFIKVGTNPLPVQRVIKVWLEAGDYFDGVTVTQKGK